MTDQSEWGPWIDHDGHGFPVAVGTLVDRWLDVPADLIDGEVVGPTYTIAGPLRGNELPSWLWVLPRKYRQGIAPRVLKYRIGKPPGLVILQDIAANLPELIDS